MSAPLDLDAIEAEALGVSEELSARVEMKDPSLLSRFHPAERERAALFFRGARASTIRLCERIRELERDIAGAHALIARQSAILTGVANALKGPPEPLKAHSHHDLAEIAKETAERETAHGDLLAVIHRDGGHHVGRVGWARASTDAIQDVIAMRARVQELEHGVTMLRDLEASAVKSLETDNARLRATALTFYTSLTGGLVTRAELDGAVAHGAELETDR